MVTEPITRAEYIAEVRRLDQADAYNAGRLDSHILDYRREVSEMKSNFSNVDRKIDQLLDNQAQIKGRDGVVLVIIGATVSVLCTVIATLILGVIH